MNGANVFEIIYLVTLLLFSVILAFTDNRLQYVKRYLIFYVIFTLIYELVIVFFIAPNVINAIFLPGNIVTAFLIAFFSVIASSFGGAGIILQEDEELRHDWEISPKLVNIGAVVMVIFLALFIWYFISLFFEPTLQKLSLYSLDDINRIIAISMYRLLFFLFFMSGFYVSRNIRVLSDVKRKILFFLSILTLILAILDGIFNISIRWSFLYFNNIYFGFFFIFQGGMFIINIGKGQKASISIIMWISLLWLIAALFFFENISILTEFPNIFPKWLLWLYLAGFLVSFRYRIYEGSF